MELTLVILAAGMGSRYGGLKQLDGIGPGGEIIMDFSIAHAIQAGFTRVLLIIRRDFESEMRAHIEPRFGDTIHIDYVFQELDALPEGVQAPSERNKPWGTGHALWLCRDHIASPFAIINADDYYGEAAYPVLAGWLQQHAGMTQRAAIISYSLERTLSDSGPVSRGICNTDEQGCLTSLDERLKVQKKDGRVVCDDAGNELVLPSDAPASMNLFGFLPDFMTDLDQHVCDFFRESSQDMQAECFLPVIVSDLVQSDALTVDVVPTDAEWMGVTYPEDRDSVAARLKHLVS